MKPTIYNVQDIGNGQLSIMARPVAGEWIDDEFEGLRKLGIDHVVSLLERDESAELGLEDEELLCRKNGMRYTSFPIPDRGCSGMDAATKLAGSLASRIDGGEHVVIHCRAGIGRTGMVACAVLVSMGLSPRLSIERVSAARGVAIPDTDEQLNWIESLASHSPRAQIATPLRGALKPAAPAETSCDIGSASGPCDA